MASRNYIKFCSVKKYKETQPEVFFAGVGVFKDRKNEQNYEGNHRGTVTRRWSAFPTAVQCDP